MTAPRTGIGTTMRFEQLHSTFAAAVTGVQPSDLEDASLQHEIRQGLDRYAVLVFRRMPLVGDEQVRFAQQLDGELHATTTLNILADKRAAASAALTSISNVDKDGAVLAVDDRRRMSSLGNRLWHTDASFVDPAGRYSMLSAQVVPPVRANTDFADMRSAFDALAPDLRNTALTLRIHHSIVYSRGLLGFEFTAEERGKLGGAEHPLVRALPRAGRSSLYLASHASHVVGWPVAEGRLFIAQLMEHATQSRFIYSHSWEVDDFVIWDNRATMHRAQPFDDKTYPRQLTRTTTLDYEQVGANNRALAEH